MKFADKLEKKISEVSWVDMTKVVSEEKIESSLPEKSKEEVVEKEWKKSKVDLKEAFGKMKWWVWGFLDKVEKKISEVSGVDMDSVVKMPEKKEKEEGLEEKK